MNWAWKGCNCGFAGQSLSRTICYDDFAGADTEAEGLYSCAIRHLKWQLGEAAPENGGLSHSVTAEGRQLHSYASSLLTDIPLKLGECLNGKLAECTASKGRETFIGFCNGRVENQMREQLHLVANTQKLVAFPRQLVFYALTGRALSRARLGLIVQSKSDMQEALDLL